MRERNKEIERERRKIGKSEKEAEREGGETIRDVDGEGLRGYRRIEEESGEDKRREEKRREEKRREEKRREEKSREENRKEGNRRVE